VIELPGVKPEDIDVTIQNNTLSIKGEKHIEREERKDSYFFSERQYGAFQRSFRLPPDASEDQIEASFNDGVLEVKIARKNSQNDGAKKIAINA
jgi:HSP20 family protein